MAPARNRQSGTIEDSVDDVLSESERSRPAGAAGERNAYELQHGDDHRFVDGFPVDSLTEIEHEVELSLTDALDPAAVVADGHANDLSRPLQ